MRPDFAAEQLRGVRSRALQNLHRRQSGFFHQLKLAEQRRTVNRADVSSISAGRNCYSGILQRFQVLERDIVGFLDPIERVFRLGQRRLDPIRQFI